MSADQIDTGRAVPGLVRLLDTGEPGDGAVALSGSAVTLGRGQPAGWFEQDGWVSREHLRVRRAAGCWAFEDPGSRNGSYLDGERLQASAGLEGRVVVRLGRSLCWAVEDVTPFLQHRVAVDARGYVVGAALHQVSQQITLASRASNTLLVLGPSGAGKELAARAFHEACVSMRDGSSKTAPFIAVNCATIPAGVAERLLFGAAKGAYSGATNDSEGYIQAANGGTLFLDELAELEPLVQAKLLRVLETREVTPLGGRRPQSVDIRVCGATLKDIREEVAAGRFREDLYYRLGRPEIRLPALQDRLDELPHLVIGALAAVDPALRPSVTLLEACALRPWPGNVRELLGEVRRAGFAALQAGVTEVRPQHLAKDAGLSLPSHPTIPARGATPSHRPASEFPGDDEIRRALEQHDNNVSAAARELGLHRNQLRRWLSRNEGS